MGLIHIYCGDGKGKTTCAVGLAVRFAGAGGKVLFCQFMKNQKSSERNILENIPDITVMQGYKMKKFSFNMNDNEKYEAGIAHRLVFEEIKKSLSTGKYGMLVMDEIMSCVNCGFLSVDDVAEFLKNKPDNLEIVMTGRNPNQKIAEYADYISEICKIKHPYDKNISARKGIEF